MVSSKKLLISIGAIIAAVIGAFGGLFIITTFQSVKFILPFILIGAGIILVFLDRRRGSCPISLYDDKKGKAKKKRKKK
jgi:uncharacterized membrane protein YoaK (UPF0700 family)